MALHNAGGKVRNTACDGVKSHTSVAMLYKTYNGRLVNYLRGKLSQNEDPQDFAHDVFIRLVEIGDLPEGAHLENLIFRIARTMVIDEYRKQKTRKTDLRHNFDDDHFENDDPLQDQILQGKQKWSHFKTCLDKLPPKCKLVFVLHRVERYSQKEIAMRLGISVSAIEKHMVKAVSRLTKSMRTRP